MKPILFVACVTLLASMFSAASGQEARVEQVKISDNKKGTIFLNEAFYINYENSPVQIKRVTVRHIPKETAALADAHYDRLVRSSTPGTSASTFIRDRTERLLKAFEKRIEEIRLRGLAREKLTITIDARGQEVVAVKFGIIVYDAFKEFLGGLTGVTMDPPTIGMSWNYNPAYLFKFQKYGVVGVYVRQARLKDGRIWNFDEDFITNKFSERLGEITREQIVGSDG